MKLTARDYGAETQTYAILCQNLASCLDELERSEEAENYRRKADEILRGIGL
jgi:hypothetical protein